jgi:hypothetical protein
VKVISNALHSVIVVVDTEVALLEDVKPGTELQNV